MKNLILLLSLTLTGCSYMNESLGLEDDNFFEEQLEEAVLERTGYDLDFTPYSEED